MKISFNILRQNQIFT